MTDIERNGKEGGNSWAMICHFLVPTGMLLPSWTLKVAVPAAAILFVWRWRGRTDELVDEHGRQALNWLLTLTASAGLLVAAAFGWTTYLRRLDPQVELSFRAPWIWGPFLLFVILVFGGIAVALWNGIRAYRGRDAYYPFALPVFATRARRGLFAK